MSILRIAVRQSVAVALVSVFSIFSLARFSTPTQAAPQKKKPNILVIWRDDVGYWNISAYNHGMMGLNRLPGFANSIKPT